MQPIAGLSLGGMSGMQPLAGIGAGGPSAAGGPEGDFKNLLLESIGHVNEMQQNADRAVETLLSGGDANAAEVLTAMQKADMSFRLMLQIRNKLTEAFQQVQAIQI
jgi:flagellar hook-basal body complex protein FliE